jgi:hypothetical protein
MNNTTIRLAGIMNTCSFSRTGSILLPAAKITAANFYANQHRAYIFPKQTQIAYWLHQEAFTKQSFIIKQEL